MIEKRFGTSQGAASEFIKAENSAKEHETDNSEICVRAKMEVAACYLADSNYNDAYVKYDDILYYVLLRNMTGYIYDIAKVLHDISKELGRTKK